MEKEEDDGRDLYVIVVVMVVVQMKENFVVIRVLMEKWKGKEKERVWFLELELKEKKNEFEDEIFCEMVMGKGVMASLGDGRGVMMGWNILEEILWGKGVECIRRMKKVLEYGGMKRKEGKRKRKEKGKRKIWLVEKLKIIRLVDSLNSVADAEKFWKNIGNARKSSILKGSPKILKNQ